MAEVRASRRRLLEILGVAGSTSVAGCSFLFDSENTGEEDETTPTSSGATNYLDVEISGLRSNQLSAVSTTGITFVESQQSVSIDSESAEIATVNALPAQDVEGDKLRLIPGKMSANEIREFLFAGWGIDRTPESTVERIDEMEVEFQGGPGSDIAAFIGILSAGEPAVLISRGPTVSDARTIVQQW